MMFESSRSILLVPMVVLGACGGQGEAGGGGNTVDHGTATDGTTEGVACAVDVDTFNDDASVQQASTYAWSCADGERHLEANGIPDHEVGTFPNPNNPSAISAQSVSVSFTTTPELAETTSVAHIVGYALNGVKLDPATAATCSADGDCTMDGMTYEWNIEALGQTAFDLGTDDNHAHVQPTGAYHYHGIPERYLEQLGDGSDMILVAWALDGFPIYARYGHEDPMDASSPLVALTPSWQKKAEADAGRPSTSVYPMGTFSQDWTYVEGSGDLDACNGRFGVTPEFPDGIYHYLMTDTYPYLQRCVSGVAEVQGPPGAP